MLAGVLSVINTLMEKIVGNAPQIKKPEDKARDAAPRRVTGPEAPEALYMRLATLAVNMTSGARTPEQEMVEEQKTSNRILANIDAKTGNARTPF